MNAPLPRWLRLAAILPIALLLGRVAIAQEQDETDPPDRVARLSYIQGDVSLSPSAGSDEPRERAELNRPLTTGDELEVGDRSRAELQVDVASLHVGDRSTVDLLDLDDRTLALRLVDGEMVVHVRELRDGDRIEIETGNSRVSLMEPGEYRLLVEDDGDTTVVGVRDGGAEIESGQQVYSLHASQEGRYTTGSSSPLLEEVRSLGPRNELEAWADSRESRDYEDSASSRYVSRDVIGYEDLDEYGEWETDSLYGPVWYPRRVSAGWAPYRFGQWAYIGPWGWTWIDQAPWGFAPFHYGRWAHIRSRWCWVPGPRHVRPVYAPALVGWVPRGGGYAWFPLGPREVYVPRHHASDRYVRQVNVSNTRIVNVNHITNVYHKREAPGRYMNERAADHVKALPRQEFIAPRIPARYVARATPRETRAARPTYQAPRAEPSRDRDWPKEWKAGTTGASTSPKVQRDVQTAPRETPRDQRASGSAEIPRRAIPSGSIPSGTIPGGNVPRQMPPVRGNESSSNRIVTPSREVSPPRRTVSPPRPSVPETRTYTRPDTSTSSSRPPRTYSPPPRAIEREAPRQQSVPERRAAPQQAPPPRPPDRPQRQDRLDRRNR
jgi:hypothetical protein